MVHVNFRYVGLGAIAGVLAAGCGTNGVVTEGHWSGTPAAAAPRPPDGADASDAGIAAAWPTSDPDPTGGTHDGPAFGGDDAGAPAGAPHGCSGRTGVAGDHAITIASAGGTRTITVHVPPTYDPAERTMLVLNFHGFGSAGYQEVILTRMNAAADRRNFVVAYPDGVAAGWNAGDCCGVAWTDSVDDVRFVKELVARLEADYCIDPSRVFATGMSNGGFLTHRLGCAMADTFAAIAPVAGVLGIDPAACHPSRPVPVLDFHGTADPIVPFGGGTPVSPINFGSAFPIHFRSVADTITAWRAIDGCTGDGDGIYARGDTYCRAWTHCAGGSDVTLCTIDGGGHTWPGGVPIPIGKTSTDISATDTMLDFFDAHPMP
jgi:polyhydroxybutyrate depolymerase